MHKLKCLLQKKKQKKNTIWIMRAIKRSNFAHAICMRWDT